MQSTFRNVEVFYSLRNIIKLLHLPLDKPIWQLVLHVNTQSFLFLHPLLQKKSHHLFLKAKYFNSKFTFNILTKVTLTFLIFYCMVLKNSKYIHGKLENNTICAFCNLIFSVLTSICPSIFSSYQVRSQISQLQTKFHIWLLQSLSLFLKKSNPIPIFFLYH